MNEQQPVTGRGGRLVNHSQAVSQSAFAGTLRGLRRGQHALRRLHVRFSTVRGRIALGRGRELPVFPLDRLTLYVSEVTRSRARSSHVMRLTIAALALSFTRSPNKPSASEGQRITSSSFASRRLLAKAIQSSCSCFDNSSKAWSFFRRGSWSRSCSGRMVRTHSLEPSYRRQCR